MKNEKTMRKTRQSRKRRVRGKGKGVLLASFVGMKDKER